VHSLGTIVLYGREERQHGSAVQTPISIGIALSKEFLPGVALKFTCEEATVCI
jgi:hypothetical protein